MTPTTDSASSIDTAGEENPTATPHASDLTAFRRDVLAVLAEGPDYGLGVKRSLERYHDEEINHGQIYPNLNALVEMGLVEKSTRDRRTNEYSLTREGVAVVRNHTQWLIAKLDMRARGGA